MTYSNIFYPKHDIEQIKEIFDMTQEWKKDFSNIKSNDDCSSEDVWWLLVVRDRYPDELHYGPYSYDNLCDLDMDLYDPYFDQKTTYFYKLERNKDKIVVPIYLRDIIGSI